MITVTFSHIAGSNWKFLSASLETERGTLDLTYLIELLAVFLLLEFLPVPIDFDILLMGGDNFILDFVCSLLLGLILKSSAVSFSLIGLSFDRVDRALGLSEKLLEITYTKN